jgi:trigger factor
MKTNVEELSSVQRKLTVTVPAEQVDKTMNDAFKRLGGKVKLKGFRPGKAPRRILEQYYGMQVSLESAEALVSQAYGPALEESGLQPVAQPSLDYDPPQKGQDFSFEVTLDVRPEFELDPEALKKLELKEPDLQVTDEEIDRRLEELRERQAILAPLEEDRPAETGDILVVDYASFNGDEPVEQGEAENVELELGAGQVQEEIEVALVKAKVGDQVSATVNYDDRAANEAVRGKSIRFDITVKAMKKKVLPELDDELAASVSPEFETLDALKERMSQDLEKMYEEQRNGALRDQIMDQIRDLAEFELPGSLVAAEQEELVKRFKDQLKQSGLDPEQANFDDEKLKADFLERAQSTVKAGIVLGRISDLLEIDVGEEDVDAELEKLSGRVGQPAGVIKEIYKKNNMMPDLRSQVLQEKTLQAIKADATITIVDPAELVKETAEKATDQEQGEKS